MTIALWCILAMMLVTYGFTIAAKSNPDFSNRTPRAYLQNLQEGWRQRAHWAQANSFEAFPPFAAAVLVAHLTDAPQAQADMLALAFVGIRIIYGLCYIWDKPTLRSLVWTAGIGCVVGLFGISA